MVGLNSLSTTNPSDRFHKPVSIFCQIPFVSICQLLYPICNYIAMNLQNINTGLESIGRVGEASLTITSRNRPKEVSWRKKPIGKSHRPKDHCHIDERLGDLNYLLLRFSLKKKKSSLPRTNANFRIRNRIRVKYLELKKIEKAYIFFFFAIMRFLMP